MKRRTLIERLGAASAVGTGLASTASASPAEPPLSSLDVDGEVDVSDVEGTVSLATLLDDRELRSLSGDVDPARRRITVAPGVESIDLASDCCQLCEYEETCPCSCCDWVSCH